MSNVLASQGMNEQEGHVRLSRQHKADMAGLVDDVAWGRRNTDLENREGNGELRQNWSPF